MTWLIYFDQSIYGRLIGPSSPESKIIAETVWPYLHDIVGNPMEFSFTLGSFLEGVGVPRPKPSPESLKIIRGECGFGWPSATLEILQSQFASCAELQESALRFKAQRRLDLADGSVEFGKELAEQTIGNFLESSNLQEKLVEYLAWATMLQLIPKNDDHAMQGLLHVAAYKLQHATAVPLFRLGDSIFWAKGGGQFSAKPSKDGKIGENKDYLDAELVQVALTGSFCSPKEKALVVASDPEYFKRRLSRGFAFFDGLYAWGERFPEISYDHYWNLGRVLQFGSKDTRTFEVLSDRHVTEVVREMRDKFNYRFCVDPPVID